MEAFSVQEFSYPLLRKSKLIHYLQAVPIVRRQPPNSGNIVHRLLPCRGAVIPIVEDGDVLVCGLGGRSLFLADYDIVTQQQLLELACATHAMRMGSSSGVAVSGMFKHINQMLNQR
jgi:hypothetical protein